MKSDCFISVILPVEREHSSLQQQLEKLSILLSERYVDHEIILIGTCRTSKLKIDTLLTKIPCIRYLHLNRELDIEIAITAGLDNAIGDYIIIMRPEQDPIELIPEFISLCQSGYDVVYGVQKKNIKDSLLVQLCKSGFSWFCRNLLQVSWIHQATYFRCLSRQIVNTMVQIQDNYRCIRTSSLSMAGNPKAIDYNPINQNDKNYRRSLFQNIHYGFSVIFQNSLHPLRIATWLGIIATISNLVYIFYILAVWAFKNNIAEGWISSTLPIFTHFLLFSIMLTIFSEYLGTVLTRIQHKPLYSIAEEKSSDIKFISEEMHNVVKNSLSDIN